MKQEAATSYARMLKNQGRNSEAMTVLQPVYCWFTEGFDTKDLREAAALLAELEAPRTALPNMETSLPSQGGVAREA